MTLNPWIEDTLRIDSCSESTVLIVDADARSRIRSAQALEEAGYLTLTAPDVETALELAAFSTIGGIIVDPRRSPDSPDLELTMIDALRSAEGLRHKPLMVVSALHQPKQRVEGLRRGASDYLAKPFECEEIVLRLSRLITTPPAPRQPAGSALRQLMSSGDATAPVTVDRYLAQEVVGRGAMGVVLAGVDPHLRRPVAIKVLDRELHRPVSESADARQEGMALARFDHPNIVKIYDTGVTEGLPYLVMELVDGESLATRLERGPLEVRQAVAVAVAVARALEAAHQGGWLHRDIKPANILIATCGAIKVTDFGLASLAAEPEVSGKIFGTPGYTPPECLLGEAHTTHGDLFALGSVLYYCLTGKSAFAGDTLSDRLSATVAGRFDPLPGSPSRIPRPLRKLVDQLLAPLPSGRPESAGMVARRLEWIAEALAIPALPNDDLEPAETIPVMIN